MSFICLFYRSFVDTHRLYIDFQGHMWWFSGLFYRFLLGLYVSFIGLLYIYIWPFHRSLIDVQFFFCSSHIDMYWRLRHCAKHMYWFAGLFRRSLIVIHIHLLQVSYTYTYVSYTGLWYINKNLFGKSRIDIYGHHKCQHTAHNNTKSTLMLHKAYMVTLCRAYVVIERSLL